MGNEKLSENQRSMLEVLNVGERVDFTEWYRRVSGKRTFWIVGERALIRKGYIIRAIRRETRQMDMFIPFDGRVKRVK